ncbi:uncharacterized protein LOC141535960 [Cotesia typhae]|uniref:uncharacterized protein LOC141535960 n=1 Tax=Cotesia typhae TaxID=2053667 RepID=UPI003D69E988
MIRYNYKKTNWTKFAEHLDNTVTEYLPYDRNLTIKEIDDNILKLEEQILEAIESTVPRIKKDTKRGCQKYVNSKIKKLHKHKSILVVELFKCNNNTEHIKTLIKNINKKLSSEFKKSETAYWEALAKNINYKDSSKFFPNINRHFRYKEPPRIDTLKVCKKDNILINSEILNNTSPAGNTDTIFITEPTVKLNVVGKYFELINSPRHTNQGTHIKQLADNAADNIKSRLQSYRTYNFSHTNFAKNNPAYYPTQKQDTPKYLYSYIQVAVLLKKAKNKTSSGLDNIPMIVLKHLPTALMKDYTVIINNSFNLSYYPTRWKRTKVIPIKKKNKDHSVPASNRPISLTNNLSKIYEKLIKDQLMSHADENKIIPDTNLVLERDTPPSTLSINFLPTSTGIC